jgi:hypothetical protein
VRVLRRDEGERVPETGAVGSVQEALVELPASVLADVWRAESLEPLARSYWRLVRRISLGAIRVAYEPDAQVVFLLSRRLPLLRFHPPEYEAGGTDGSVTWRIERGLLGASEGRGQGYLRIAVRREGPDPAGPDRELLRVVCEVRNFYPLIRGRGRFARFGAWLYAQTQLRLHALVCNAFLRSLARLELPPPPGDGRGG